MEDTLSSTYTRITSTLSSAYNSFLGQTKSNARLNVIASYDQSNELFKAFLSSEMMYSCALWDESEGGVRGDLEIGPFPGDLEAAQRRKIHHVLRQARLKPGYRVLEFGSGWGGLAIEVSNLPFIPFCDIHFSYLPIYRRLAHLDAPLILSPSPSSRRRLLRRGSLLPVYPIKSTSTSSIIGTSHPNGENAFDAFVSVEMLEHVGSKHYANYFRLVSFALKPHNATAVVSASTFPESRYSSYQAEDFMRKYMWPNSCLPSASALIQAASPHFNLERVENHAAHYPRTLREWGRRLEKNLTQEMVEKDYPGLSDKHSYEAFKRKWMYLFAYAGAGFAKGYITCHMLTFIREVSFQLCCMFQFY